MAADQDIFTKKDTSGHFLGFSWRNLHQDIFISHRIIRYTTHTFVVTCVLSKLRNFVRRFFGRNVKESRTCIFYLTNVNSGKRGETSEKKERGFQTVEYVNKYFGVSLPLHIIILKFDIRPNTVMFQMIINNGVKCLFYSVVFSLHSLASFWNGYL